MAIPFILSPARRFQADLIDVLRLDTDLSDLVGGRIYDAMPANETAGYPAIEIGPSYDVDADSDCITARETTVQIDVWSRDQGRLGPCKDIVWAVRQALHRKTLYVAGTRRAKAVGLSVPSTRVMQDPDGITAHGVVTVRAVIED